MQYLKHPLLLLYLLTVFSDSFMNESDDSQGLFRRNFQSHASGRQKKYCTDFWSDFQSEWKKVKSLISVFYEKKTYEGKIIYKLEIKFKVTTGLVSFSVRYMRPVFR